MQNPQNPSQRLYSTKEICALYNIDVSTIRKRIHAGLLQAFQKPGTTKNSPYYIVDPNWQHVILHEKMKHGKGFNVDDVHVFRGVEVAIFLGITPRGVRKMADTGRLGFAKTGLYNSTSRRYSVNDLRKAMAMREKGSHQERHPSKAKIRSAVMKWGYERLGIKPPENHQPTCQSQPTQPEDHPLYKGKELHRLE